MIKREEWNVTTQPLIRTVGLCKRFGSVQALQDVEFHMHPNEVVGLIGEKGAGKSTLVKILSGLIIPDKGEIYFEDRKVSFKTPRDALELGIEAIHQDLALIERANVYRNIFLGREIQKTLLFGLISLLDTQRMADEASKLLSSLEIHIDSVKRPVKELSEGQKQAVAIARSLYSNARLLIMDEPTAALGKKQVEALQDLIIKIKKRAAVIFATPNLDHLTPCADRIVILDRGRIVGIRSPKELTAKEVMRMILNSRMATTGTPL